ncbi:penicillin-insensitive murein endopeptidase [Vibrio marisflavi]|uniref:Penicillin-insensitive murein endopeptidase n=1 Tax=Vibrio marisflavi CECT 7928 TaxID=634439 RepID=A0ABN8E6Q8_9VIBR|nr:penicillin-insensitive murein endopeptidase [Vibrio marisflavi]CAH0541094.1 Penicillin-insensitive murein endopeptidase [Vibrio marisflavi CECT 7928]
MNYLFWVAIALLTLPNTSYSTPWEKLSKPSARSTESIGSYSNGCLAGGVSLPLQGIGYQVIRSQNLRYFGHKKTIRFVRNLAHASYQKNKTNLLVGDISLPQGGQFSSGHASHQTGLDVDIWFRTVDRPLSKSQLRAPIAISVVDIENYQINSNWSHAHFELLKLAASDEEVTRIFVHPVIKKQLCKAEMSTDREWLRKIRPWFGHHYHFHVRLSCSVRDKHCYPQKAPPQGDGCGAEIASWKPEDMKKERHRKKFKAPIRAPEMCLAMLRDAN